MSASLGSPACFPSLRAEPPWIAAWPASRAPHHLVLLLDTTVTMPLAAVQPAIAAFLHLLQPADHLAIVGYNGRIGRIFPAMGLASLAGSAGLSALSALSAATLALEELETRGVNTSFSGAFVAARRLLDFRPGPKYALLVAASPSNRDLDPLAELPRFPVHTLAIGDQGQAASLREIAQRTGATWASAAPGGEVLAELLRLAEQLGLARTLARAHDELRHHETCSLSVVLDPPRPLHPSHPATFLVFWGDSDTGYEVGSRQVGASLVDPLGRPWVGRPTWAGNGFAVFSVPDPVPGLWTLLARYRGGGARGLTLAAFSAAP